jgi:hypothetical protein
VPLNNQLYGEKMDEPLDIIKALGPLLVKWDTLVQEFLKEMLCVPLVPPRFPQVAGILISKLM